MKENIFFKVGYTSYLEKNKEKWTSRFIKKIIEHKFIFTAIAIIIVCTITNFFLIYRFIEKIQLL